MNYSRSSLEELTADYNYSNWVCLVNFFCNPGWKIALIAGDQSHTLRSWFSVRCLWPLDHGGYSLSLNWYFSFIPSSINCSNLVDRETFSLSEKPCVGQLKRVECLALILLLLVNHEMARGSLASPPCLKAQLFLTGHNNRLSCPNPINPNFFIYYNYSVIFGLDRLMIIILYIVCAHYPIYFQFTLQYFDIISHVKVNWNRLLFLFPIPS